MVGLFLSSSMGVSPMSSFTYFHLDGWSGRLNTYATSPSTLSIFGTGITPTSSQPSAPSANQRSQPAQRKRIGIATSHQISILITRHRTFLLLKLDIQAQPANLITQHVERHRRARLQGVVAFHHRLVNLRAAFHVVGF